MIEQHVYVYPRENEVAFLCEFRNLKRQKSETAAEYGHSLRILAQKACIPECIPLFWYLTHSNRPVYTQVK